MATLTELVTTCLLEIERKYGTGRNDGEFPKKYHNRIHTENVIADVLDIANLALERHKITLRQQELLHIAAAFHDIEQDSSLEYGNELASADIMDSIATPTNLFTADELLEIREIILGTEVVLKHGVKTQVYAQSFLAQALADADLAALGKPIEVYMIELENYSIELFPEQTRKEKHTYYTQTLALLKNHHFFTPEAEYLFKEQAKNLQFVKNEVEKLANAE